MKVLFNASVVLAGLYSTSGASGMLLDMVKTKKIKGVISELIFNEAVRHADKIGLGSKEIEEKILAVFENSVRAPDVNLVERYYGVTIDDGDAHVFASCEGEDCDILVSLDKKHILVLRGKIKNREILSPGELLLKIRRGSQKV